MSPSERSTMNHPWVQQTGAAPPWRRAAFFVALSDGVQIRGTAAVGSMPETELDLKARRRKHE